MLVLTKSTPYLLVKSAPIYSSSYVSKTLIKAMWHSHSCHEAVLCQTTPV